MPSLQFTRLRFGLVSLVAHEKSPRLRTAGGFGLHLDS